MTPDAALEIVRKRADTAEDTDEVYAAGIIAGAEHLHRLLHLSDEADGDD